MERGLVLSLPAPENGNMNQLSLFDYHNLELNQLEEIIERGMRTFVEVGLALLAIREGKKYTEAGYSTFEKYLQERWGISRPYGYNQIDAGYIANSLSAMADNGLPLPTAERQVRPLVKFGNALNPAPEKWAEAWSLACEIAEGKVPTSREVDFVVKEMLWQEPAPMPEGFFRVIYADPPWQFDNSGFDQSAANQYPTMSTLDICGMYIPFADNSALFLWATNAMLKDALFVMEEWGFEYKTNFVWTKNRGPSIGFYVQSRHELLLLGIRGEGMLPEVKPLSIILGEVTKHSKKPEIVYELIESMYDGPYLELFARNEREGWESWGNDV